MQSFVEHYVLRIRSVLLDSTAQVVLALLRESTVLHALLSISVYQGCVLITFVVIHFAMEHAKAVLCQALLVCVLHFPKVLQIQISAPSHLILPVAPMLLKNKLYVA
jgi:hypothetical protein